MTAVLSVSNLHLEIAMSGARLPVLRNVNLEVETGSIHGLIGESGAGKTMVGKTVLGILPPSAIVTDGVVRFAGQPLSGSRKPLLGRHLTMVLQNPMTALNPVLRIQTQITDVLRRHERLSHTSARKRAEALLDAVHIREPDRVLRQYPHELSGGMRQRVIIAIAFSCHPELVIADEPTTALDVTVQKQILRLIKEQQAQTGAAVLFITHDLGVVAKICDKVSVIHSGRILESAPVERLFESPEHDYTRAILGATPRHDRPHAGLRPVPSQLTARLWNEAHAYDQVRRDA